VIHSLITATILFFINEGNLPGVGYGQLLPCLIKEGYFFIGAIIHFFTYYLVIEFPFKKK